MAVKTCGEFSSFPVHINNSKTVHYLFMKAHKTKEECAKKPQNRTLFLLNVPPYFNDVCLSRLFEAYGKVEVVYLHDKPTASEPDTDDAKHFCRTRATCSYQVAYVVFQSPKSLQSALRARSEEPHQLRIGRSDICVGVQKWCSEYNSSQADPKALREEIETFMGAYDAKVEEEKQKAKEAEGVPDEEGWITVTKHGKKPVVPRTEAAGKRPSRKKRSEKALLNFYSYQIRESKMEQLAQLRKKFQEDKARIAVMRANRKFRPY